MDCERSPALDLNPLPVDHSAGVAGAAAALGAYLNRAHRLMRRGAMILTSWAMSCAISGAGSMKVASQLSRAP
jgi:hypothetical protein